MRTIFILIFNNMQTEAYNFKPSLSIIKFTASIALPL